MLQSEIALQVSNTEQDYGKSGESRNSSMLIFFSTKEKL